METIMIQITARAIIASSNFAKDFPPVEKRTAVMDLRTGDGPFTVLGNIASGFIFVNGANLGTPWLPLNQSNLS